MKNLINRLFALIALVAVLASCAETRKNEGYVLNVIIHGYDNGPILLKKEYNDPNPVKYTVKDGKFTITGEKLSEPKDLLLEIKEKDSRFGMYVDNGVNTIEVKLKKETCQYRGEIFLSEVIRKEGSIVNKHEELFRELESKARAPFDKDIRKKGADVNKLAEGREKAMHEANRNFIKSHPDAFYSAYIARRLAHGQDADGLRKVIALLDPKMDNSHVRALKAKLKDMELTDVDPSEIIKAKNVAYKVSGQFNGKAHTNVKYLGMMSNDQVCALNDAGEIKIIDAKGKEVKNFKPEIPSKASTIAVDKKDNIYIMYPLSKKVTRKFRGRTMEVDETYGYEAAVFNIKGEQQRKLDLKGLKTATGARIANGKLLVADWQNKIIGVFNTETGAKEAALEDMRPCCAILDFAVNAKNEVLVANLGAFRVQAFDLTGKNLLAFGKRGKGVSDFHGCCNPVGVAYLNNGAIVTVEKDPTRVKVFSSEGAKTIAGIDELVKGCSYIPMIVDSKDNLYLASPKKGMIKCVSI
jgi:hypothetical protein